MTCQRMLLALAMLAVCGPAALAQQAEPPRLLLHGCVKEAAARLGVKNILVSLSHTDSLAAASVVLQG